MKKFFFLPFIIFLGCQNPIKQKADTNNLCNPEFFYNYATKHPNKIIGIGISKPVLYGGENKQRKIAISKALNEIALQKEVKISSMISSSASKQGYQINKNFKTYSLQSISGKTIKAKIIKACKAKDGKYYVLMETY